MPPSSSDADRDSEKHEATSSIHIAGPEPTAVSPSPREVQADVPDGGFIAWLQVVGGFFIFMDTWGIVNAYGAFQTVYETGLLHTNSPSAIAWIGSVQGCVLLFVGALSGPVFDKGYFRLLVIVGAVLTAFGMLMTSFGTRYIHILLAQGICVGLGTGLVYIPCVAVIASYFNRRRALALGISAAGSGAGGVIFPAILLQLEPTLGFAWATRVIALVVFTTLVFALVLLRRRVVPVEARRLIDLTVFRDRAYVLFTIGLVLGFMGSYVPFYYISTYATTRVHTSENLARYLVPVLNAASVLGRIVPSIAADAIGAVNTLVPCVVACGALVFGWVGARSLGALLGGFAIPYGFFAGTFVSITNAALVNLTDDPRLVGTRIGMSFTCAGVGILIGNPVAGALIDVGKSEFVRMQIFSAVLLIASALFFIAARLAKVGAGWRAWI